MLLGQDPGPVDLDLLSSLPGDRPFTAASALAAGVKPALLRSWVRMGALAHPMRGVYHRSELPDSLELRVACLQYVVPPDCVVTDRTAAWLWGAKTALAPGSHEVVPRVQAFCPPGRRLRNGLSDSGERTLLDKDVQCVRGVLVTSPLRTACDLGRLLSRDQAIAAMDAMAARGLVSVSELVDEAHRRFKGYRGIVQLRSLGPLVDAGSESPGESVMRLRWIDAGLPRPQCQVEVPSATGGSWWLDMGLEEDRFAGEYDGEEFHTKEADRRHDEFRRSWLRDEESWTIVVARRDNVFGRTQDVEVLLRQAWESARYRK